MRAAVKVDASVSPGHVPLVVDGLSRRFILVLRPRYAESHSGWASYVPTRSILGPPLPSSVLTELKSQHSLNLHF